jgi:hypothetical protein
MMILRKRPEIRKRSKTFSVTLRHLVRQPAWQAAGAAIFLNLCLYTFSFASQSAIEHRSIYTTERQYGFLVGGTWGFDENIFATGSITHWRSAPTVEAGINPYYAVTGGAGYAVKNIALDVGFTLARAATTAKQISATGGYGGITYIHAPEVAENPSDEEEEDPNKIGVRQLYVKPIQRPALFWVHASAFTYSAASKVQNGVNVPKVAISGGNIDGYYPIDQQFQVAVGGGLYSFPVDPGYFYSGTLKYINNTNLWLVWSTLRGLPRTALYGQLSWQITAADGFMPRYTYSQVNFLPEANAVTSAVATGSTSVPGATGFEIQTAHTFDLIWRHQLSKHWFLTPAYELSIQSSRANTALLVDLNYSF